MSAADRDEDGARRATEPAEALSALEAALRQALASAPRDQVVKAIVTALPAEVLMDQSTRMHGKVKKVSVSMPEELTEAVRARTGTGGFSRYVTDAVQEQIRLDLLDDLIADFEAKYGPIPDELVEEAMREWPDYPGK
jgi:hypothetical protein